MQRDVTPRNMPHWLLQQIALMNAAASGQLSMAQRRYECDLRRNFWLELKLEVGEYVFVDHLRSVSAALDAADELANHLYIKLLRRPSEPWRVLNVYLHTVAIEEDSIPKTVSIDCITLSITWAHLTDILQKTTQITWRRQEKQQHGVPSKMWRVQQKRIALYQRSTW